MNYFEDGFLDNYIDKIRITRVLDIPVFNEEFNAKNDFNELKAGDFTLTLSLLDDARSANGDNLHDFFFANDRDNRYLVVVQFKEPDVYNDFYSRRCGFIDPNSIEKDTTISKNKWEVTFSVTGMLREFAEYFSASDMADAYHNEQNIYFDYYLYQNNNLGCSLLQESTGFDVSNKLNFLNKIGFIPKLSSPIHHDILNIHISENKQNINRWALFKELAKGFGFVYRLICISGTIELINYPHFSLNLLWRTDGLKNISIRVAEVTDTISNIYNNKWIYQASRHEIWRQSGIDRTLCMGWALNKDNPNNIYNYDKVITNINFKPVFIVAESSTRWGYSGTDLIIKPVSTPQFLVKWNDVMSFKEILYIFSGLPGFMSAGSITFPRCFVRDWNINQMGMYSDTGVELIKLNTAIEEYKFLISGVRSIRKVKIYMDDMNDLSLFCTTQSFNDGKTYWCQRIDNLNIYEQTADCEFVEI